MGTAEHIYNEVRTLPESQAREVLDFVAHLKAKRHADAEARRTAALRTLAKYRGRFEAARINRDELYDRKVLR
jgi:DNA-binding protein H-NS